MHGVTPELQTRYGLEIAVCKEMQGWSHADFLQAPEDMIEEIVLRMNADGKWEHEKYKRDKSRQEAEKSAQASRGRKR